VKAVPRLRGLRRRGAGDGTPRRVVVVYWHPVPTSLCATARDRVLGALAQAGDEYRLLDLHAEGFDPVLSVQEWKAHGESNGPWPGLEHHAEALQWADSLVFVYPTWFSSQPAMVKGWFDRVFTNGVAYEFSDGDRFVRGRLRHIRRVMVVTTHGSSRLVNRWQGESGLMVCRRALRTLVHPMATFRWVAMYGVDGSSRTRCAEFLNRVEREVLSR
jgi:NAD(P)H dehydrogenase (quinone)